MALYEYVCDSCKHKFERISSFKESTSVNCPKCNGKKVSKLFSRFAVAGRGDLRETTMHGCHDCHVPTPGESASHEGGHDHGHDHGSGHDHEHGHGGTGTDGSD